jgi:hypothetical protein
MCINKVIIVLYYITKQPEIQESSAICQKKVIKNLITFSSIFRSGGSPYREFRKSVQVFQSSIFNFQRACGGRWTDYHSAGICVTLFLQREDGRVELWHLDTTLDELLTWTRNNCYIPEPTCEQRELYQVEPLCEF